MALRVTCWQDLPIYQLSCSEEPRHSLHHAACGPDPAVKQTHGKEHIAIGPAAFNTEIAVTDGYPCATKIISLYK